MLDINKMEADKKDELIKELNIYTMLLEKTINYVKNPELVIAEMVELNHGESKEMFENVALGIKGEFTKQRAIELGKLTLLECVTKQAQILVNKYFKLKEASVLTVNTLNEKIKVMGETCSMDQIAIRRDKYMATLAGKEWVVGKINKLLNDGEFGDNSDSKLTPEEFLDKLIYKLSETQSKLGASVGSSDLKEAIAAHETQFAVLTATSPNGSIVELHDGLLEELATVDNGDSVEINLVDYVKKAVTTASADNALDRLELLNKLIDLSKNYQLTIVAAIESFAEVLNGVIDTDDTCDQILAAYRSEYLEAYAGGKLPEEEILLETNKHTSLIRSHIIVDNDLMVKMLSNGNYINACISIYFSMYDLLDKVTLVGTIVEVPKQN